jgi:hypothetical protein
LQTYQYKSNSGDVYQTVDGTIFKKTGFGYVGYIGYHGELIFLSAQEVCMNGSKYGVKVYEWWPLSHYSLTTYQGAEAYAKYNEICGDL